MVRKGYSVPCKNITQGDLNITSGWLALIFLVNTTFPAIYHQPRVLVGAFAHLQRFEVGEQLLRLPPQQILIDANRRG